MRPDYTRIRVPVLAMYRRDPPYLEFEANFNVRTEQERTALKQLHAATRAMIQRWQRDVLTGVPSARIVELPGANLYMFLSHDADVLREVRAFASHVREQREGHKRVFSPADRCQRPGGVTSDTTFNKNYLVM